MAQKKKNPPRPRRLSRLEQLERFYTNTSKRLTVDIETLDDISSVHLITAAAATPQVAALVSGYRDVMSAGIEAFKAETVAPTPAPASTP
jgi:hypothetical protein